ncbi:MAG TPA: serine/threonine-protein kinase [Nitrospirota bacterium]|nr:serine/threonine-protein kinase [Nitrospirota bacterium]
MIRLLKNRYEILEILGRGGMGCVYKVADRFQGGKILAAKELLAGNLSAEKAHETLAQFQTEARILTRLTHPNLPKVYDYFSFPGRYYIIMEYVKGKTLEKILHTRKGRPVDERQALSWALQVCKTMHFLTVQKPPVVFRDLKPANIMIDRNSRVRLIDFGIARFFKEAKSEDTFVYGTPGYAAPEQYGTGQTDVRSDIFSLGATLHHCLTGRNPSENPLDFPDPRSLNPKLSKGTAEIIRKALQQEREKRFQSALEMKQAIQRVLIDTATVPKGVGRIILAKAGKPIRLPVFRKFCWVSVPITALGCSGTTGRLSTDELWIQPRPKIFGPDASSLLFRVESRKLKLGREYRPEITVKTEEGIMKPELLFKKSWLWIFIEAVVILAAIVASVIMRYTGRFR